MILDKYLNICVQSIAHNSISFDHERRKIAGKCETVACKNEKRFEEEQVC